MRRTVSFLSVIACVGCVEKDVPTGSDGAAYFGFVADSTRSYADGALVETHSFAASSVSSADGVTVDLVARDNGGFVVQARSMTLEFTGETSFLRRFNDCVTPCAEPAEPIPFLDWPVAAGDQKETVATVTLSENGDETGTEEQKHTIIVGDEADVTVPAGTFTAFTVSWTITRDADVEANTFALAPDDGIVRWQTADGKLLELQSVE